MRRLVLALMVLCFIPSIAYSAVVANRVSGSSITFDSNGKYPTDALGKHAAIYLEHNTQCILVLDQWNDQGEVKQRPIWFNRPKGTKRSNDGDTFYVIE